MRRFLATILCATALTAVCARADEFSWQLAGGGAESDIGPSAESESATLAATYYFRPVDDTAGPYALAPFLHRSSRIGASYNEDKTTALVPALTFGPPQPTTASTVVTRAEGGSLSGRYIWRNTGWYAGAGLAESEAAHPAPLPTSFSVLGDEMSSASLSLGKYVARSTAVELSFEAAETTLTSEVPVFCRRGICSSAPFARVRSTIETESESIEVSALHVGSLGRLPYSLSGGVTSIEADATIDVVQTALLQPPPQLPTPPFIIGIPPPAGIIIRPAPAPAPVPTSVSLQRRERYALGGELFPTPALGFRLGYSQWDGDEAFDETWELGATWLFKRKIGAQVVFARTRSLLSLPTADDLDTVSLQVFGRL